MGPVQEELPALGAIVNHDSEATRSCNHELLEFLVRMPASYSSGRHVIEVIDSPNRKRNVAVAFNEREVTPMIRDFREINNSSDVPKHFQPTSFAARLN